MRKTFFYLLGSLPCLIVAVWLPIIPVQMAASVPALVPVYSLGFTPIIELVTPGLIVGVQYHIQWYTLVSILVLLVISGMVGIWIVRTLMKKWNAHKNAT